MWLSDWIIGKNGIKNLIAGVVVQWTLLIEVIFDFNFSLRLVSVDVALNSPDNKYT